MAIDSGYFETDNINDMDDVAALLVKLYGDYKVSVGGFEDDKSKDYAMAVGIAIRMLQG